MKKICLVSEGQPSTNPRLVKEADALHEVGYDLVVIFCQGWADWAMQSDKKLLAKRKWKYKAVVWSRKNNPYLFHKSRLRFLLSRWFCYDGLPLDWREFSLGRVYPELLRLVMSQKADLYIAHYLGALSAAAKAAEKNGAKLGFDAEDFHSAESGTANQERARLIENVEKKHLPACDYVTAASEPIAEAYAEKYKIQKPETILNVSSLETFRGVQPPREKKELRLYWFSQTIGPGRGLEDVLLAMGCVRQKIRLYLQGFVREEYKKELMDLVFQNRLSQDQIVWIKPAHPDDLVSIASAFDVGLALEQTSPLNRDLCVTNKVFTYLTAGLSIIATRTRGQNSILSEIGKSGWSYPAGDFQRLASRLQFLAQNPETLEESKRESLRFVQEKYNWVIEKNKFLSIVKSVLG